MLEYCGRILGRMYISLKSRKYGNFFYFCDLSSSYARNGHTIASTKLVTFIAIWHEVFLCNYSNLILNEQGCTHQQFFYKIKQCTTAPTEKLKLYKEQ